MKSLLTKSYTFQYEVLTYVQGKYSSYLVLLPHSHQYQVSTYVLDSGHFIDLYIDGHSIEATTRPR